MNVMKKWGILAGVVIAVLASAAAPGYPASGKIDPFLAIMTRPGADLQGARTKGLVKSAPGSAEPLVSTLLKFEGGLSGVESNGGRVRSIIGNVATVDIPVSAVSLIAALPNVTFIEAARPVKPLLDVSVPATGASLLRTGTAPSWTGNTGRNVIVGIVDTGIDLTHKDFKDASGKTRILSVWDQNAKTGTPPTGYLIGNECTNSEIDAGACSQTDTYGHGTHVTGIAAGNGSATGNGKSAYRYVGMAPEADIIMVNTDFTTTGIIDGIAYIESKAAALGKPCVINLSLGGAYDPHDGTSNFAKALDNASGTGKVIVAAAGNEAMDDIHGSGTLATGQTMTVGLTIPGGYSEALDLWYSGNDQMGISVSHGTEHTPVVSPGTTNAIYQLSCGKVTISSSNVLSSNDDREIVVFFEDGTNTLCSGAWSFSLSVIGTITNGRFDGWSGLDSSYMQFTDHIDSSITIGDTGSATKPISVASYNTKNRWDSLDGNTYVYSISATLGDISSFSSLGPRRTCSNIAKCPSIQKPEIAAPGMGIMSSLSAQTTSPHIQLTDPDGVHILEQGTSMATPHVTGAVALMLQADPTLTSDGIKALLENNTTSADSFTGSLPNDTWGYGKLSASASFAATPNPAPAAPTNFAAGTPGDGYVPFTWTANTELDLDGYNLYRSTAFGGPYTKANASLISYKATTYNDITIQNSTTYYYKLRAVDTKVPAQESPDSSIVSAATTSTNPPPAAPTGLTASATATATLTLSWNADTEPDLAGFNLFQGTASGGPYATQVNTGLISKTATSYVNSGLAIGTTYYYVLRAVDGASQESGNSNQASGTAQTISSGGNTNPTPPTGGGGGGGGCFIATAAYGSYLDPHVKTLRDFRDQVLLQSGPGRAFVNLYYAWSPPIAAVIAHSPVLRLLTRLALTPVVIAVEYPRLAFVLFLFGLLAVGMIMMNRRRYS